jgi:hypothetical protein
MGFASGFSAGAQATSSFNNLGEIILRQRQLEASRAQADLSNAFARERLEAQLAQSGLDNAFRERKLRYENPFGDLLSGIGVGEIGASGAPPAHFSEHVGAATARLKSAVKEREKQQREEEKFNNDLLDLQARRAAKLAAREARNPDGFRQHADFLDRRDARQAATREEAEAFRRSRGLGAPFFDLSVPPQSGIDFSHLPPEQAEAISTGLDGARARLREKLAGTNSPFMRDLYGIRHAVGAGLGDTLVQGLEGLGQIDDFLLRKEDALGEYIFGPPRRTSR